MRRVDVTRDDRDIEADELRGKLEVARKALEAISKHPPHNDRLAHCLSWSRDIARQALEDTK